MARVPRPDPLEYDPTGAGAEEPAEPDPFAGRPARLDQAEALAREAEVASPDAPRASGALDQAFLFDEEADSGDEVAAHSSARPSARNRGLRLDFSQVQGLEQEHRASKLAGATRIDEGVFLSRSQQAALARAKVVPKGLPSLIERDERSVGIRIVHESRRFWLYLALGVAIPALLVGASVFGLSRYREAKLEREIQELQRSVTLHRQLEEARLKQIAR